jgi:hypothetical protein
MRRSMGQRRFSDYFGISKGQSQLDFVDVPLDTDIELYVDPYALHISPVDCSGAAAISWLTILMFLFRR